MRFFSSKIPTSGSRSGWLAKFNGDFLFQRYIAVYNPSSSSYVKLLTDKHTDKQTNTG